MAASWVSAVFSLTLSTSSLQPFWYQGPVGRQFFHGPGEGWGQEAEFRQYCKRSFRLLAGAYLLLCGLAPNSPRTSTGPRPGGAGEPALNNVINIFIQNALEFIHLF